MVLNQELYRYNYRQLHSTTQEIPYLRFQRALKERKSLFRVFRIPPPYKSVKDVFCLRIDRTIDPYRRISINALELKVKNSIPREMLNLRIYPMSNGIAEVRFWCKNKLIDVQRLKNSDLNMAYF